MKNNTHYIDSVKIKNSIKMLEKYIDTSDLKPFMSALEAIQKDPQNETLLPQLADSFNDLGIMQGAVLTYAPYIGILLAGDALADN